MLMVLSKQSELLCFQPPDIVLHTNASVINPITTEITDDAHYKSGIQHKALPQINIYVVVEKNTKEDQGKFI